MLAAVHEPDSSDATPSWRSLSALRAFDAIVRLGSFKAAADELRLTPSAISHQIKTLEGSLGAKLFHRQGRAVVLSEAGLRLAPYVRQGFVAFLRGATAVRGGLRARQIRVSSLALFNQTVLIPNLAQFSTQFPDFQVRIETSAAFVDFGRDDIDLAIRVGDGRWPGLKCTELLAISGVPVASPAFLTARASWTPEHLIDARLIHDTALPVGWERWLAAKGVVRAASPGDLWFDTAPATLHAAEQGLGVALAIDPLIRLWPGYGTRLTPLFPNLTGPRTRYWLVRRPESDAEAKVKAFAAWLQAACCAIETTSC